MQLYKKTPLKLSIISFKIEMLIKLMTERGLEFLAKQIIVSNEHMKNGASASAEDIENSNSTSVCFRRLDTLLLKPDDFSYMCKKMAGLVEHLNINKAVFLDSRGYLYTEIANMLDLGIVKACKTKKVKNMIGVEYGTEYSKSAIYMLDDVLKSGDRVLIVDDLIATGGSVGAAKQLSEKFGATVVGALATIALEDDIFIKGQKALGLPLYSLFQCKNDGPLTSMNLPFYPSVEFADDGRTVVMSHSSSKSLADNVIDQDHSKYRYGNVSWQHFGDTYPNITFDTNLKNRDVIFVMSMHSPSIFMEQLSVLMVLPRQQIRSLKIMMSYFAPGTMDRVDSEGIMATAETVATILSSCMPQTQTGPPILEIYDIHALQERFYFKDKVIVELKSAIPLLIKKYNRTWCIVFPDDGANKRFGSMFTNYPIIVCSKVRVLLSSRISLVPSRIVNSLLSWTI